MIALIDYGMGNLFSVEKAFVSAGAKNLEITKNPGVIKKASAVILPGVGNFGLAANNLRSLGLDIAIKDSIAFGKPFFGICLGLQLLMNSSEEAPGVHGLGILNGKVIGFSTETTLKIPQIGWNSISILNNHKYLSGIKNGEYFYFVHSYYVALEDKSCIAGTTEYGIEFCSCVGKDNIFATQFHPEKSQDVGLQIIRNFVESI